MIVALGNLNPHIVENMGQVSARSRADLFKVEQGKCILAFSFKSRAGKFKLKWLCPAHDILLHT